MPRRNIITYMMFIIVSSLTLFACSAETSSTEYSYLRLGLGDQYGVNDQGVLIVNDGLVLFHDFEAGENVVVCNLPDCTHEPFHHTANPDPICLATHPNEGHIEAVGMYGNAVLMFVNEGFGKTVVYQVDIANSNRKELVALEWNLSPTSDFEFIAGFAYFVVERSIFEEGELSSSHSEYGIMSLNLETGETGLYGTVKDDNYAGIRQLKKIGDHLYYEYNYFDFEGEYDFTQNIEEREKYYRRYLYETDIKTNEERILLDLSEHDGDLTGFDEDYLYFIANEHTEFTAIDWTFTESEVLFTGEYLSRSGASLSDGVIFIQHPFGEPAFEGPHYYYDFKSKETRSFNRPLDETPFQLVFDDWIFLKANFKDGQADLVMMKLEDYLAGETDYIYLKTENLISEGEV